MKTPEQMADEYGASPHEKDAFLAGYQAAKDEYKIAIDTYNDVAKQMLEEAVRIMSPKDQLADTSKVMDTCEHILDMEKMVDVNSPEKPDGWFSVKDRLPEDWDCVLWLAGTDGRFECGWEKNECANSACKTGCGESFGAGAVFICEFHRKDKHHEQHYLIDDNNDIAFIDCFTHWMPLPEAPKGEG